jgi:hypothetical protein
MVVSLCANRGHLEVLPEAVLVAVLAAVQGRLWRRSRRCDTLGLVRTVAAFLLAFFLGQALGLPALEGPCVLAQCADEWQVNSGQTNAGQENKEQGDCSTPCAACLCCGPIRTLPPLGATSLTAGPVTPTKLLAERDAFLPDSPPHEILHVPKA